MTNEELLQIIQKAANRKARKLDLSGKSLTTLPPEIGQLTNLRSLHLNSNQLSSLPPEFGQLTNLQSLNLSSNQLSSLPPEFGQLTNLQSLNLSSNQLSSLPPEFGQLTQLQSLNLSSNQLSSLPPEIVQLTQLQFLDLNSNQLSSLPPEFGQLTQLQSLNLNSNKLSSLPPEFGQLTQLQSLNLNSNKLSSLPPEFGQLTQLQFLDLNSNQLSSLPPEFGQLINLQTLHLWGNQLSSLPGEIGQLINLQTLHLGNQPLNFWSRIFYFTANQLSSLPGEIGQLTNLQSFDLSNQLSSLPGEIGQLTNLQTLDLNSNQLSSLPGEIGQLTNLQTLDLNSNQLSSLPGEIGQLTNLQTLHLNSNQLSSLPPEIGQLTNLQTLDLNSNQLSSLPGEIGQLTNLQTLDLNSNQLSSLPPEIGQLTNLQTLDLNSNQLSSLPGEIGQLTNLQTLDLIGNQLNSLPPEIVQLTNLQTLDLIGNQLSSLPPEIVQLTNLQTLHLSRNQLSSLPPEIGQLTNLQSLYLYNNQLSSLPPEIGQLTNLQTLELDGNQLSSLPKEIGLLSKLKSLGLRDNELVKLPPEIGKLRLARLRLGNNPLPLLPPEIRKKGFRAIQNFYKQQLEQETDRLYEAKLIIVGEGGAGKTTLAKKIQDNKYTLQQDENTTEGIDVIQWKFLLDNNREFQVNIWDFGGQEIYHATHQFFLTKRSLYALVADTRKEDTDFYYWLNVVELLSGNSPLLIVKNEKQERKREINERELRREFTNFKETLTTNLATDRGLPEILNKIKHYITNLPHVGIELPKSWVKVREALEGDSREYISLKEYQNICQKHGFTKQEDKLQLSGYLHDLGVCLHFQDDDFLIKTIILKPTWGTDAVYKVLDNPQVIEKLGQFDRNDLADIWHEEKYADMRPELLRLMMKFKLSYEIPSRPGTYIAPQLLSVNKPDYTWDDRNNLILRYTYTFMPKGILTRFIVETHPWIEQQKLVWKSGVVLNKDQTRAEIIENYNQREIKIRVAGNRTKELMAVITHELDKIHNSYERLQYQTLVPCNCKTCKNLSTPYSYSLDKLTKRLNDRRYQIECENSYQMVDVYGLIDVIFQSVVRADRELNPQITQLQRELEQERNESLTHRLQDSEQEEKNMMNSQSAMELEKEIFISYASGGENDQFVNQLDETLQAKGIKIIRDKRDLGYKGSIKAFMERIGRGKCAIAVISDKYLKSPNCMFELVQIAKNGKFYDRIFPIVLADAQIYKPVARLKYIKHWEDEIKELDEGMREVGAANLQGFREEIDQYTEIRNAVAELTNLLKDMNTLTPDIHSQSDFESLLSAIVVRLDE